MLSDIVIFLKWFQFLSRKGILFPENLFYEESDRKTNFSEFFTSICHGVVLV